MTVAICACGWSGTLGPCAVCPGCERAYTQRITKERAEILHALARGEQPMIQPIIRIWLRRAGLIAASDAAPKPRVRKAARFKGQRFALTAQGVIVEQVTRARRAEA